MSNKDVRKPAPGAAEDFAARRQNHEPETDEELLASCTPEELAKWVEDGHDVRSRLDMHFNAGGPDFSRAAAKGALHACTRFLRQLVSLTGGVLETVDVTSMRKLVANEMPLPRGMRFALKAAGIDADVPKEPEAQHADHRKRPRASKHPLIALIQMAVQATRLIQKITAGTNPGSQNLLTKEEKAERRSSSASGLMDLPDLLSP